MKAILQRIRARARASAPAGDLLSETIEAMPTGVLVVDRDGRVRQANGEALRMFGYPRAEIGSLNLEQLLPKSPGVLETLLHHGSTRARRAHARSTDREALGRRSDRSDFPIQIRLREIATNAGTRIIVAISDLSQQKRLESAQWLTSVALRERDEQLRGFFESSAVGMALTATDGRLTRLNRQLCALLGYTEAELVGTRLADLAHPDERAAELAAFEAMLHAELDNHRREGRYLHKNGTPIWVAISTAPVRGEGKIRAFATHVQDIRDRRQTESALLESEGRFRALLTQAPIGIFETDAEHQCVFVNERCRDLIGLSRGEISGEGWTEHLHPDDRDAVLTERLRAFAENREFSKEYRFKRADGEVVWVQGRSIRRTNSDGVVTGYLGTIADVTEQKRAEQALTQTTALWRGILDGANYSIIATSPDGAIREFNRAAERMLGYAAHEVVGRETPELIHARAELAERARTLSEELGRPIAAGFEALVAKARLGAPDEREWTYRRKDGSEFPALVSVTALLDDHAEVSGYLSVASDITERRRVQNDLIAAKEAAESATRAKSDFLARMSHEIRTPMNSVIGMSELALQTTLTTEQREYLQMVNGAAKSLLHIINDILDFSRIEAGRMPLEYVDFELRACLGRALRGLSLRAAEKGLKLDLVVSDDVPQWLVGDPHRLQQILINLVSNALKFTQHGEVSVTAEVETQGDRELVIRFGVRDTGIGISPDKQSMIFQAFTQAEVGVTRRFGGTGLGLAICSQLIELMQGRIWVESEPDRGSLFQFTAAFGRSSVAERVKRTEARAKAEQAAPAAARAEHPPLEPLQILVAEDNSMNQRVVQSMLARGGHSVTVVGNGRQALDKLDRERFDLVLMDVEMPELGGIEAVQLLRARERDSGQHLPVVALTAQAMKGDRERCLAAGMDAYIPKPLDLEELEGAMRAVVSPTSRRSGRASRPIPKAESRKPVASPHSLEGLSTPGTPPVSRSTLLERLGNDPALLVEITQLFDEQARQLMPQLEREVMSEDEAAKRTAHQIRGMLLNLSANAAGGVAKLVEEASATGNWCEAKQRCQQLLVEVERVRVALLGA